MLRGYVFKTQTFTDSAFAHFIYTFLNKNNGVTKGCELSYTNNSVSISAGYFSVFGRFLEIMGNETIENITNTGFYQLICELDLSKVNTPTELNQATIKLIRGTTDYTNLVKEDLDNNGKIYQFEFARFKVETTGITNFVDSRTFLNINSIYSLINSEFTNLFDETENQCEALIEQINTELNNVKDRSDFLLKSQVASGTAIPTNIPENGIYIQFFEE